MLYGRASEQAELTAVLDAVTAGRGQALVLRGRVGAGRSALLCWTAERAEQRGFRVLRINGIEGEHGLAYGGLSQVLLSTRDRTDDLVPAQAEAVKAILDAGQPPGTDGFLYGLATLGLLTLCAEDGPVLCVVDDAHWLDPASATALLFSARRLSTDALGMVFAVDQDAEPMPGLRELPLAPLSDWDADQVLAAYDLPRPVRARVRSEAEGNPLALRELAIAGDRFGDVAGPLPISGMVSTNLHHRLAVLDDAARLAVLVAASEGHGNMPIIVEAIEQLGLAPSTLDDIERAGLIRIAGNRVLFDHPLVRNACYRAAPLATRSTVHRALAEATTEPSCRSYHLWSATSGPDEVVATALCRAGEAARQRRAHADAATQYGWAADLTPGPEQRGNRLLAAADMALLAGDVTRAASLAEHAEPLLTEPGDRLALLRVRATLEADRDQPDRAAALLLGSIDHSEPNARHAPLHHPVEGISLRELLTDAAVHAWDADEPELVRLAQDRARLLEQSTDLSQALAALVNSEAEAGLRLLTAVWRKATDHIPAAIGDVDTVTATDTRWGLTLGDATGVRRLATTIEARAREHGLVRILPETLVARAHAELWAGYPADAEAALTEAVAIIDDTCLWHRTTSSDEVRAQLAALTGDEHELARVLERLPDGSRNATDAASTLFDA